MPGRDEERFLALVGVCDRRLGDRCLAKAARAYGFGVAASYAVVFVDTVFYAAITPLLRIAKIDGEFGENSRSLGGKGAIRYTW